MRLRRVLAVAVGLWCALRASQGWCATITIVNADLAGEGFNDSTAASPIGGNSGTTRGAQALNAFQYAANVLGALLYSDVEVIVTARFMPRDGVGSPLLDCGSSWAVLGAASPDWVCVADVINDHPNVDLWYPGALCNRLAGVRLEDTGGDPYSSDIGADFNGRVGKPGCLPTSSWYFGFDANAQNSQIDLVSVVLHELSHGLGFLTFAGIDGAPLGGTLDVFMAYAYDNEQSRYWYQMTNNQRLASSENDPSLVWRGPRTVAAAQSYLISGKDINGRPRMYAPASFEAGSSVSHFTNTADPSILMEPTISPTLDHTVNGIDITLPFLQDIGWRDPGCDNGILEGSEACDDGALNSDTTANACRTSCELPSCGDGVRDSGEDCDDGDQNSTEPGHCRPGCVDFLCGDGVVDTGEDCDEGGDNANQPDTCRLNCSNPVCGDQIIDSDEQCDDGVGNGNDPDACRAGCVLPTCGDGVIDSTEECDDGALNANLPGACQLDCTTTCGDGVLDPGEECDEAAANGNTPDSCRSNCLDPGCGDSVVDTGEDCDDHNRNSGDGCDAYCKSEPLPGADAGAGAAGSGGGAGTGGQVGGAGTVGGAQNEADAATGASDGVDGSGVSSGETDGGHVSSMASSGGSRPRSKTRGACSCRTVGAEAAATPSLLWLLALALMLQRRRKC